ncbi:MAG TPA: class I SAM-dependent methyltransferase [Rhizomicrobium sp.]|nr:class I SAM-dependent methyltransferase [Rhizomicrobium sp.]
MDLKEEEILGGQIGRHWYYRAKAAALIRDLGNAGPREILDIGAGSGYFSRVLLEQTAARRATCVDTGYPADRDDTICGKPIAFRRAIDQSRADLVLAMDVLEHVPDEKALLSPYIELVPRGTRFVISVPAFDFLWSSHDVFLRHYRRYTLESLERAVRRCGLAVDRSHYYFGAVFPIAAGLRLMERMRRKREGEAKSQLRQHSGPVNGVLSAMCALERPAMKLNRLFGLTAFAICHKP